MKLHIIFICLILAVCGVVFANLPTSQGGEIASLVKLYNPSIEEAQATQIEKSALFWTEKRRINLYSFLAIIIQESKFDPDVEGKAGERGLGQISKTCLKELKRIYGEEFDFDRLFEIDYNLRVASLHYRYCVELADHDRREAIARYRTTFSPSESGYYAWRILRIRESVEERLSDEGR